MKRTRKNSGQTIAEYVLIIAIVVVAAIGILGLFSDTVRAKIAGAANVFGADQGSIDQNMTKSETIFKDLKATGTN